MRWFVEQFLQYKIARQVILGGESNATIIINNYANI